MVLKSRNIQKLSSSKNKKNKNKNKNKKGNTKKGVSKYKKHLRNNENDNQNISVNIINKKLQSETDFGGYPLDLLFGILYLKRKYPRSITLPFDIKNLLITYSKDMKDRQPFTFVGCILYKCLESIIQKDIYKVGSKVNLEQSKKNKNNTKKSNKTKKVYKFNKNDFNLEFPGKVNKNDFKKMILKAKASKKQFTIIPLILKWGCEYEFDGHANILIFDFKNNTVERFEPYGYISTFSKEETTVSNMFNQEFKNLLKSLGLNLTFLSHEELIKKGPQFIEEKQINNKKVRISKSDPEGYCGAWSLWYADLRIKNKDKSASELISEAINKINHKKSSSLRGFIRSYSQFLIKERYKFLKKIGQKNPYDYRLRNQLSSLEEKKSIIQNYLQTNRIIMSNSFINQNE